MQTRALKTLLEIDRAGSFAAAAARLNMTLSAVSMQMKTLEGELGVTLFDRAFRPPKLTPMGATICAHAARVMGAEADLMAACRPTDRLSGSFRIGFVATASVRLLPGFLTCAKTHAPDARFDIETGLSEQLENGVLSGRLDAAVLTASQAAPPDLTYHTLREEPLVYVAPATHAHLTPAELFDTLPFFHFLAQSGIGKLIASHVAGPKRRARNSIFLDNVEAIMECVDHGLGFTLLPEPDIRRHVGDRARIVDSRQPRISRRLVLATATKADGTAQAGQIAELFETLP